MTSKAVSRFCRQMRIGVLPSRHMGSKRDVPVRFSPFSSHGSLWNRSPWHSFFGPSANMRDVMDSHLREMQRMMDSFHSPRFFDAYFTRPFEAGEVFKTDVAEAYPVPGSVSFLPQQQNQPGFTAGPSAPQWAVDIVTAVRSLDKKVEDVSKKLEKLECLETQVGGLGTKIAGLEGEVASIKKDVVISMQKTKELVDALSDRADHTDFQVGDLGDRVTALETKNEEMKWQLVDTRARSMRDNLLFSGIAEAVDETPDKTEELLRGFLVDKLRMASELVAAIRFDRVHRIGGQGRPRVIVAKFKDFKQRQDVRAKSSSLKGTNFYINEQFPPEIVEQRKALIKIMKEKKSSGCRTKLVYNKLYIDGVLYKPPPQRRSRDGH